MTIDATGMDFRTLNEKIRESPSTLKIENCLGQRYIASGLSGRTISIDGTPGNALGAYLDGANITVTGNVQDAVGDTMNDGSIVVHGNAGDALGYSMRGGKIFIRGNAGYRTGIHMKEYREKKPAIVVGGRAGSFLGEYCAGGTIIVLGLDAKGPVIDGFTGIGMHGGKIYVRTGKLPDDIPAQISAKKADAADMAEIKGLLSEYAAVFGLDPDGLMDATFQVLKPDTANPYRNLYVPN